MPIAASIVKTTDGTFIPCTAYDAEILDSLKAGKPYKVEIKRGSDRCSHWPMNTGSRLAA